MMNLYSRSCPVLFATLITFLNALYYDPNDMGKANVKVSEVLKRKDPFGYGKIRQVHDWPSTNNDKYTKVNMRILGKNIDQTVLNNLRPKMSSKNLKRLKRLLHEKRDTAWTSIDPPKTLKERGDNYRDMVESKLSVAADALNLTFHDGTGTQYVLPEHVLRMFRNWLLKKATCVMDYIWEDLGPLFWPQWIRRGICVNNLAQSCSWPPGMKCRASGSRALHILYWACEEDVNLREFNRRKQRESRERNKRRWTKTRRRRRYPNEKTFNNQENRNKRIKRLIKMTSLASNGYYCKWDVHKYLINDKCSCSCA
uniref:Noggin-like protein 8 n=1 Tax=Schmidtea mediterranea TaxID=79327 RepID=C1JAC8_SCHMD|nr:noggin-like protein 8 [Schmidtea mediterranea]